VALAGNIRRDVPPQLAHAFLALSDDEVIVEQRSIPRAVAAAAAAVALAVGAPLGFLVVKPGDHPLPAVSSKFSLLDDE
jgi:predicted phosphoribosyltransferase